MIKIAANSLWECEGFIDQGKLFPDPSTFAAQPAPVAPVIAKEG